MKNKWCSKTVSPSVPHFIIDFIEFCCYVQQLLWGSLRRFHHNIFNILWYSCDNYVKLQTTVKTVICIFIKSYQQQLRCLFFSIFPQNKAFFMIYTVCTVYLFIFANDDSSYWQLHFTNYGINTASMIKCLQVDFFNSFKTMWKQLMAGNKETVFFKGW